MFPKKYRIVTQGHACNIHHEPHYFMKLLTCFAAIIGLSSCGGTGQDNGQTTQQPQTVNGLAIDGYLARSLVFIDYDNNRTRDPWEPYAFTDDDGYFSFNQKTNTDYCAATAPANQKIFCLRSNRGLSGVVIRIDGGYDVMTGEPFYGQLSRRLGGNSTSSQDPTVISPITSLLTDIQSEITQNAILTAMNLSESDLNEDYLDSSTGINPGLLNKAVKLHKTVALISQAVGESYSDLGSQPGAMNDASALVYKHLALQIAAGNRNIDDIATDSNLVAQIIAGTELDVLDYYDHWEIPLPYQRSTALEPLSLTDRTGSLSQLINALIVEGGSADINTIAGAIKLVEAMSIKAVGGSTTGTTLRNTVDFILDEQNRLLLNNLVASLADANSDLISVANADLTNSELDSLDTIRAVSQLPSGTTAFRSLAGQQLRVSDMDLGSAPNQLRDSEIEFYFQGDEGEAHGSFAACVKYIKDANINGKLGDANTRGELVKGYWSLLGGNQNSGASYSLLLTIEFLGTRYQAILKPAGQARFNGEDMRGIRFDYGNELRTWYSHRGPEPIQYSPTSATDCANRLPSRIGI